MILRTISDLLTGGSMTPFRIQATKMQIFDNIIGYQGIKFIFIRSLNSKEPAHILTDWTTWKCKNPILEMYIGNIWREKGILQQGVN